MQPHDQLLPVTAPARILSLHLGKPLIMGTQESIFVSIACLDDPDVVLTVADIVAQARHPERVFVGVCLQIDPNDSSYQDLGNFKNARVDTIHFEKAKGSIYARYRCEQPFKDGNIVVKLTATVDSSKLWMRSLSKNSRNACGLRNMSSFPTIPSIFPK